jgi:small-conductance mechanosensitive channel
MNRFLLFSLPQSLRARMVRIAAALFVLAAFIPPSTFAADAPAAQGHNDAATASEAPIDFWNRQIAIFRITVAGASPQARADQAKSRLDDLPLYARARGILLIPLTVLEHHGVAFSYDGRVLFFLSEGDLDLESGQTLDTASQSVLQNLDDALAAREAERKWPVVRTGLLFALIGLLFLTLVVYLIRRSHRWLEGHIHTWAKSFSGRFRLFGGDIASPVSVIIRSLLRGVAWVLVLSAIYLWLSFSLRYFPYTQPWGNQLGGYVLQLFENFGHAAVSALPGLLAVVIIVFIARWISRLGRAFFHQVATRKMRISWMDPDVAQATERIFSFVVWIFAIVVSYPYIPGSNTDAFKGISVLVGLVISLGSTGIINQVMSGLFVVYSKALKRGEWVQVNETEGEVLEVGMLAAKIRTIEGQEVTIPHSVLVGTLTTNYTRLGGRDGSIASTTISVGYDVPWRQANALLQLAAERTANIRKRPEPYILQRNLSDFYVEYSLIVRLTNEKFRIETLSALRSNIQDAFNEFGVQIMSPHFMLQPERNVVVPPSQWHRPPSAPDPDSSRTEKPTPARSEE